MTRAIVRLAIVALLLIAAAPLWPAPLAHAARLATEFDPYDIVAAPDGTVWISETPVAINADGYVARVTPDGKMLRYKAPGTTAPQVLAASADGAVWVEAGLRLLRLSRARHWTVYTLPKNGGYPNAAVIGPDGALWYTALKPGVIGRLDRHGHVTLYPLPFDAEPEHICVGPDGALWYTDTARNAIGRLTTKGALREFPSVRPPFDNYGPQWVAPGPDGNLWFMNHGALVRLTPRGRQTVVVLPRALEDPNGITVGPDHALWIANYNGAIGRLSARGTLRVYPVHAQFITGLALGKNGTLWFLHLKGLGRITTAGRVTLFGLATDAPKTVHGFATSTWRAMKNPDRGSDTVLHAVTCTAAACIAVGDDVLATTDGGRHWRRKAVPNAVNADESLTGIACPGAHTCFATQFGNGGIFETRNDGASWQDSPTAMNLPIGLVGMSCANGRACVAVGWAATPGAGSVHTSDGGRHWALQVDPAIGSRDDPESFNGVACITARRCVVAGYNMYTTDGGARWVAAGGNIDFMTNAVACPTSGICYTVGAYGGIAATHDGGKTWVKQVDTSNNAPHLLGVACVTTRRCYAVGEKGTIVATSNGGNTWSRQHSGTRVDLYGITCARSGRCYAVGDKGTILTTG